MLNQAQIDADFALIRSRRFLETHLGEVRSAGFWRELNPHLTITDRPLSSAQPRRPVDDEVVARARIRILEDGYLETPPILGSERIARLLAGIERVVQAGFPSPLACVYDEFCQAFVGLEALFGPLLGGDYLFLPKGCWAYYIPAGDPGFGITGGAAPHRDDIGPDPAVLAGQLPSVLNVWIPLTDVTPRESCIYVLPAACDPDYRSRERAVHHDRIRLQDIRAVPAAAGSALAWSSHLIHWGSRSSARAAGPRIALASYFQRRDVPPFHSCAVEFGARVPFETRLAWIADTLSMPALVDGLPA